MERKDLDLLVAHGLGLEVRRALHGNDAEQLQEVVLHDVAHRASPVVVGAAPLDADILRHRDLNVIDVASIPDRLEDAVRKAEDHDVLHGLLAEVVVDPVDLRLREDGVQLAIQGLGTREIVPERLLDDHAFPALGLLDQAGGSQVAGDHREELRERRHVEDPVARGATFLVELGEPCAQPVVASLVVESHRHVVEALGERVPDGIVDRLGPRVLLHGGPHDLAKLVIRPDRIRATNNAEAGRQIAVERQVIERRHQLPGGQVARGAEDDHDVRIGGAGKGQPFPQHVLGEGRGLCHGYSAFTGWPPNSLRRAASTLPLKESSCRERKRMKRLIASAGAGTAWSIASCSVQRPSPESST